MPGSGGWRGTLTVEGGESGVAETVPDDLIQPFQIDSYALRGRLVRLGPALDAILSRHDYPAPVATLLGEAVALSVVLAGALKFDGVFSLQTKGDGPVNLMVADVTSDGALRGYAQFDEDRVAALDADDRGRLENPVPRLLGAGHLAFTVDQGPDTERYQAIVELIGGTMADCAHHYFRQSDQFDGAVHVAAGRPGTVDGPWRGAAMMVQRLPDEGGTSVPVADRDEAEDGWRRALILMGSARPAELLDPALSPHQLLYRLFHEEGIRVYRTQPLEDRCRCSRARVETMLRSLPRSEIETMKIEDQVVVTCEFCSARYAYDDEALDRLYAGGD